MAAGQTDDAAGPLEILRGINGGRVLDVATGGGEFVPFLIEGLPDFVEIIGIDLSDHDGAAFEEAFVDQPAVQFEVMDARALTYPAASFDTVAMSDSLHHFEDPTVVLREMLRVLRPAGHLVVAEMYRDSQTAAQSTHVELHHWAAAINRTEGIVHKETYARVELVRLLTALDLAEVRAFDRADLSSDPMDAETIAAHEPVIARYLARAGGDRELETWGAAVRHQLRTVGIHGATELVYVGVKRAGSAD